MDIHDVTEEREVEEGIELQIQESIRTRVEKENRKFLRLLEADTSKQAEMKEKIRKQYIRRTRILLEIKLYWRNFIK